MNSKLASPLGVLMALAAMSCSIAPAYGQGYTPTRSKPSGFTGERLSSIYRQDIGTGYSGSGLNQLTLWNSQARIPYVGQQIATPSSSPSSRIGLNSTPSRTGKPFSSYSPTPTVSPYLNLFRQDLSGNSDFNYQTLVKPMLQQQQFNQQSQRQSYEIARRVQSIAAQGHYNMEGSKDQYPTGHQTAFQYYGHHYPGMQQARPRRQQ